MRRADEAGTADPVGGELRHRRQNLLRLHRAERGDDPRARPAGRLPGQQDLRGESDDRSHDRRALSRQRRRPMSRTGAAGLVGLALVLAPAAPWPAPARGDDRPPLVLPPGFRARVFAAGLPAPRALAVDPTGVVLVSLSSLGKVIALVPATGGPPRVVETAAGLHLPHGLAFRGGDLYVAETGRVLRFRYDTRTRLAS